MTDAQPAAGSVRGRDLRWLPAFGVAVPLFADRLVRGNEGGDGRLALTIAAVLCALCLLTFAPQLIRKFTRGADRTPQQR